MYNRLSNFHDQFVDDSLRICNFTRCDLRLDFARVHTFYRRDRSWNAGVGTKEGGDRRPVPDTVPGQCRDTIDPSTWRPGEGASQGVRPGKCNGQSAPGRWAGKSPRPPSDAAGQTVDVTGGWVRKTAGSGRVCHGTPVKTQTWSVRGMRSLTSPQTPVRKTPGPPSDAARRSSDISVPFLVPYRGRLKRSHLHCKADAAA